MKHILFNTFLLALFLFPAFNAFSQINKVLKIKISTGAYGLTHPTKAYVDDYQFNS